MNLLKWLYPGLKVKRWFLVSLFGILMISVGAVIIGDISLLGRLESYIRSYALLFGNRFFEIGVLIIIVGLIFVLLGFNRMMTSILGMMLPEREEKLIDVLYQKHQLKRGPKVVAVGGGTGLATMLRGLKNYTSNLTAIVTVTDDGGSSGRLRGELGILPPGDFRNCLIALADAEPLMQELLNYRFSQGAGLAGHSVGNLLLAGLTEVSGDLDSAVQEIGKVLAVRGRVIPSTLDDVQLCARMRDQKVICGETNIVSYPLGIEKVFLAPQDCKPLEEALKAISEADAIILGPGSLYTSIIPNLLVDELAKRLQEQRCSVYYTVNVMTQPGETDGYKASDHVRALLECGARIDYVVANTAGFSANVRRKYRKQNSYPVRVDDKAIRNLGMKLITGDLLDESELARHDPDKLARLIMEHLLSEQPIKQRMRRQWRSP